MEAVVLVERNYFAEADYFLAHKKSWVSPQVYFSLFLGGLWYFNKKVSNLSQSWLQEAVLQSDKWVAGI